MTCKSNILREKTHEFNAKYPHFLHKFQILTELKNLANKPTVEHNRKAKHSVLNQVILVRYTIPYIPPLIILKWTKILISMQLPTCIRSHSQQMEYKDYTDH